MHFDPTAKADRDMIRRRLQMGAAVPSDVWEQLLDFADDLAVLREEHIQLLGHVERTGGVGRPSDAGLPTLIGAA
jgi:hypothetical protein